MLNMRKVVQIVCVQDNEHANGYLTALCDDGSIWYYSGGKWDLMPDQIPQHPIDGVN